MDMNMYWALNTENKPQLLLTPQLPLLPPEYIGDGVRARVVGDGVFEPEPVSVPDPELLPLSPSKEA